MSQRRNFLKQLGGSALLLSAGSLKSLSAKEQREQIVLANQQKYTANDTVRIAGIGMGIMGYNDVNDAIKVPGVELVACCDLYDGRLAHAKELYGNNISTVKHYEDIL